VQRLKEGVRVRGSEGLKVEQTKRLKECKKKNGSRAFSLSSCESEIMEKRLSYRTDPARCTFNSKFSEFPSLSEIGACGGCTVRPFKGHASGAEKTLLRKQSGGRHTQPLGPMEEFHEV
jgi:hypothetical protein